MIIDKWGENMKNLKKRRRFSLLKSIIIPVFVFFFFIIILLKGIDYFHNVNQNQNLDLMEQAVRRATIQCYAVEGKYPSDLSYLEENYGLVIDDDKFGVEYGCFASNIMPTIIVYPMN